MIQIGRNEQEASGAKSDPCMIVDRFAGEMIRRAEPVRFAAAESQMEREQVYRLRYQAVIAAGWAAPSDFPDGMERDSYDDGAILIAGWYGNRLTAAARLVLPQASRTLPTEEAFHLLLEPRGEVVDWSRMVVAPAYHSPEHRLFAALVGRCWLETRRHGYNKIAGCMEARLIEIYASLGISLRVLGPARVYWGEARYPISFDQTASLQALLDKWHPNQSQPIGH
jgi:N-acyl-L-homoserine lactone synthetase